MLDFLRKYRVYIFEILFAVAAIAVDLVSKAAAFDILEDVPGGSVAVAEGIFSLTMTRNYGASFGVFSGKTTLLSAITGIGIALVLVVLIVRPKAPKILRYSLIMIFAGGLGNLVDRIAFGYVRDFIDYTFLETFFGIDFAIGNIADIFVMIAMGMLIVYMIFGYKEGDLSKGGRLAPQAVTAAEERGEQVEADVVEEKSEEAADETVGKSGAREETQ